MRRGQEQARWTTIRFPFAPLLIVWSVTFGIILILCGRITCDNLIMEDEREQLKRWVENWKSASPELEKVRIKEIRRSKTPASMLALSDAFDSAMQNYVIPKTPLFETINFGSEDLIIIFCGWQEVSSQNTKLKLFWNSSDIILRYGWTNNSRKGEIAVKQFYKVFINLN